MFRQAIAIAMSLMLSAPVWAISNPVGTIAAGEGASVAGTKAAAGSTLYSGDTISVRPNGKASVMLGTGSRALIAASSQARLSRDGAKIDLELLSGGVSFTSSANSPVEGRVADVTFRPENPAQSAVGYMIFKDSSHPVLYAEKGAWIVTTAHDGRSLILSPGQHIEGLLSAAAATAGTAAQNGNNQQPPPNNHKKKMAVIWIGSALAGTVTGLAFAFGQSECTNGTGPGCKVASPVSPQ